MIAQILNLLFMIIPLIIEWIKKERSAEETAQDFVRREQSDRLKAYEALLSDSDTLSRYSRLRISLLAAMLRKIRPGESGKAPIPPQ